MTKYESNHSNDERALSSVIEATKELGLDLPEGLLARIYDEEARVQFLNDRGNTPSRISRIISEQLAAEEEE